MDTIEFYFDLASPYSYLAHEHLKQVTQQYDVSIALRPILLGGVFKAVGNEGPTAVPAKSRYLSQDLKRTAQHLDVPFQMPADFPTNTLSTMRAAITLQRERPEALVPYVDVMFAAIFANGVLVSNEDAVQSVLDEVGISDFAALATNATSKQELIEATENAVNRGVFGAPTFFINDEMFWGEESLHRLKARLKKKN